MMRVLCAAQQISNEVLQPASITLTGDLSCAEHKFLNRVEQNIEAKVNDKVSHVFPSFHWKPNYHELIAAPETTPLNILYAFV